VQVECDLRVERVQEVGGVEDLAGGDDADGLGAVRTRSRASVTRGAVTA